MRGSAACGSLNDSLDHALKILTHLVVPEAQDLEAFGGQIARSLIVSRILRVLTTVKLNDQFRIEATEIRNVRSDRNLAPKLCLARLAIAEMEPELSFNIRRSLAQLPRTLDAPWKLCNHARRSWQNPSPILSPRERKSLRPTSEY